MKLANTNAVVGVRTAVSTSAVASVHAGVASRDDPVAFAAAVDLVVAVIAAVGVL